MCSDIVGQENPSGDRLHSPLTWERDSAQLQRCAHPSRPQDDYMFCLSNTLTFHHWHCWKGFPAQLVQSAFTSLEPILAWGSPACGRHFADAHHHIPRNMCIWFTPLRPLGCISCGHLWPWLLSKSGELNTTKQQPREESRLGTAVQPWNNLPLNIWYFLTLTVEGEGGCLQIVKTRRSTIKERNVSSKQPWKGWYLTKLVSYLDILIF